MACARTVWAPNRPRRRAALPLVQVHPCELVDPATVAGMMRVRKAGMWPAASVLLLCSCELRKPSRYIRSVPELPGTIVPKFIASGSDEQWQQNSSLTQPEQPHAQQRADKMLRHLEMCPSNHQSETACSRDIAVTQAGP